MAHDVHSEMRKMRQVCRDCIFGDNSIEACYKSLADLTKNSPHRNASILLDVLSCLDIEIESYQDKVAPKDKLNELCKLLTKAVLPEDMIKACILVDKTINDKTIKLKTKLFYRQLKYNLLREESEGYAKLIVELCQPSSSNFTPEIVLDKIRCLIGQFNLDPNRVLDVILECFECYLEKYQFFLNLIRLYGCTSYDICYTLGFKFYNSVHNYAPNTLKLGVESSNTMNSSSSRRLDRNFYRMTALLIRDQQLDVQSLFNYMIPSFENIILQFDNYMNDLNKFQKTLIRSAIAPADTVQQIKRPEVLDNQKLSLLTALLEVGDWESAKLILGRMPEVYAFSYPDVSAAMCRFIDSLIQEFYAICCPLYHDLFNLLTCSQWSNKENDHLTNFVMTNKKRPIIGNFADLISNVFPLIVHMGSSLGCDAILYNKIIRICLAFMEEKSKNPDLEKFMDQVVELCDECLIPGLSLFGENCSVAEQLWQLIKQFPYTVRYRFYGHWKNIHMQRQPILIALKGEISGRVRYIMKRLSKENCKLQGRLLSKLCHSNPSVVFDYLLNQIKQFENFIQPVVDMLKSITQLSYDVLAYCIIEHLASPSKEKLKVAYGTLSPWLQSLATFTGCAFKKYNIELTGLLQYVANQLKAGKSFDLCVLREIVENMSGIETAQGQLTLEQVESLCGGEILKQEGAYFNQIKNTKRSINRLKEALLQEDLVVGLCLLMSQQRYCIVYKEGVDMHLKLVGQMLDQCQQTLVQFASFLSSNLKNDDYARCMPSAIQLIKDYHISPDAAMFLTRPVYAAKINAIYDELKKIDRANKQLNAEKKVQHYQTACSQVLGSLAEDLLTAYPNKVWNDLSPRLFTTFWTLTAYDIYVPSQAYDRELEKLRKQISQLDDLREAAELKKKKDREQKLCDEQRRQLDHTNRVMQRLSSEKNEWFTVKAKEEEKRARATEVAAFLQHCVLPRSIFSDTDAIFCAHWFKAMHAVKSRDRINIFHLYDKIFHDLNFITSSMSENEANHFGRFLCQTLSILAHWGKDKETFDSDFGNDSTIVTRLKDGENEQKQETKILDYKVFKALSYKWHTCIGQVQTIIFYNSNYVPIRNMLLILTKILPYFPIHKHIGENLLKLISMIAQREKETRLDLHTMAMSYLTQLKLKINRGEVELPRVEIENMKMKKSVAPKAQSEVLKSSSAPKASTPAPKASTPAPKPSTPVTKPAIPTAKSSASVPKPATTTAVKTSAPVKITRTVVKTTTVATPETVTAKVASAPSAATPSPALKKVAVQNGSTTQNGAAVSSPKSSALLAASPTTPKTTAAAPPQAVKPNAAVKSLTSTTPKSSPTRQAKTSTTTTTTQSPKVATTTQSPKVATTQVVEKVEKTSPTAAALKNASGEKEKNPPTATANVEKVVNKERQVKRPSSNEKDTSTTAAKRPKTTTTASPTTGAAQTAVKDVQPTTTTTPVVKSSAVASTPQPKTETTQAARENVKTSSSSGSSKDHSKEKSSSSSSSRDKRTSSSSRRSERSRSRSRDQRRSDTTSSSSNRTVTQRK